ncbi:hypothetical protein OHS18_06060 [Amycolatopsis sp. NBC_00355]|uniref:hypothetical protein n=1 Tax=Amycolatopsis sp. NBC_00355 TaxID=2975957 RepID=UPI002E26BBEF
MTAPREIQFPGWWESTFTRDETAVRPRESGSALIMGLYGDLRDAFAGHSIAEVAEYWYDDARGRLTRLIDKVVEVVNSRVDDARQNLPRIERAKAEHDRAEKAMTAGRNAELRAELEREVATARNGYHHLVEDYESAVSDVERLQGLTTELYELLVALEEARPPDAEVPADPAPANPADTDLGSKVLAEGQVGRAQRPHETTFTPVSSCLTVVVTTTRKDGAEFSTGAHLSLAPADGGYASDEILDAFVALFGPGEQIIDCVVDGDAGSWCEEFLTKSQWTRGGERNYSDEELARLPPGDIRGLFHYRVHQAVGADDAIYDI